MTSPGCIILAAGSSSRLGQPKQLLPFRGETLIRRSAKAALQCGCSPVAVVLGSGTEAIQTELQSLPVIMVPNPDWQKGMGTSIFAGLMALIENKPGLESLILLVCDQPRVEPATLQGLIQLHETTHLPIVASRYAGTLGVPALFHRSCFLELLALPASSGAKPVIETDRTRVAEFDIPEGRIDIDTPADQAALRAECSA